MFDVSKMQVNEQRAVVQAVKENGVVVDIDNARAAQLGHLMSLPTLGEALSAWGARIAADECVDYESQVRTLTMRAHGELSFAPLNINDSLPMTYRVFGGLLRHYTGAPRNVARNLVVLTTRDAQEEIVSPRSFAYNDSLARFCRHEKARMSLDSDITPERVILRTRLINGERTIMGHVTPKHSLRDGDDDRLIAAISLGFAGDAAHGRAQFFRGIEESELRTVFPATTVEVPGTGGQKWAGYMVARNSESGSKSWSIAAGLYRPGDGASVACEVTVRTGRHVGHRVAERMVEIADDAREALKGLIETAEAKAVVATPWTESDTLRRIRGALTGTIAFDADVCCGIAFELGRAGQPITVGRLMGVLAEIAAKAERRVDARPLEVLLGRVLTLGWDELHAVAVEGADDGSAEE